jgi:MFS family permease
LVLNVFRSDILQALSPRDRRNLAGLLTAGLLFWASLASLLPTFSPYLKHIGAPDQQIGLVMGAFAIGLLLFRPSLGRMADRRGRWIVLLIGVVVAAIAPLGYLLTQSIPLLILIRSFHGLSIAAFTTAYSALAADLSPPQNRGELMGYLSLVNPIGMAIGPALGGFIVTLGYTPLFLLSAGLGGVAIICVMNIQVRPLPPSSSPAAAPQPFWQILWQPRLRIPTCVMWVIGMAFGTLATFLPLLIQETHVDFNAGLFYTAAALASFGSRLLTGRASDRYGRGLFITLGIALYALSMGILWLAHSPAVFLLAGLIEGAGSGIFLPLMITLVADRAAPQERGQLFGLCISGFDCGIALAGLIFGTLTPYIGYRSVFALAGLLAWLGLGLFVCKNSKDLPHSLRFALGRGRDVYAVPQGD